MLNNPQTLKGLPANNVTWDTFNELYNPVDGDWDTRPRWYKPQNMTLDASDASNPYGGVTLKVDHDGTDTLGGKYFYLDEMKVKDGDTLRFYMLGSAPSGTHRIYARQWDGAAFVGSSVANASITCDGTPQFHEVDITVDTSLGTTAIMVASYDSVSSHEFSIYAMWGGVYGLPAQVPNSGTPPQLPRMIKLSDNVGGSRDVPFANRNYLRSWGGQIAKIQNSDADEQAVVVLLGDSWTNAAVIYENVRDYFQNLYGDGGIGGVSLQSNSPLSISVAGTWTESDQAVDSYGVDISHVKSTDDATPASRIFGSTIFTDAVIHYIKQSGGGDFRWKIGSGGAWTNVDTSSLGTVHATETISGLSDTAHTLYIEILNADTNGVILTAVDFQRSGNAVRFHEMGNSGAQVSQYVAVNSAIWGDGLTALAPDVVLYMTGTNEHSSNVPPATFRADVETLVDRIRAELPLCDVVLMSSADNGLAGKTYTIADYDNELQDVAIAKGCGFISGYRAIGSYADGNSRGLYGNTSHLNTNGYTVLANTIIRFFNER